MQRDNCHCNAVDNLQQHLKDFFQIPGNENKSSNSGISTKIQIMGNFDYWPKFVYFDRSIWAYLLRPP